MIEGIKRIELSNNEISIMNNLNSAKVSPNVINGMRKYYNNVISSNMSTYNLQKQLPKYNNLYNEKKGEEMTNKDSYLLNNFDEIYDKLTEKIDGFGSYIENLEEAKKRLNDANVKLETDRKTFNETKSSFESYIADEKKKIEEAKKEFELIKKAQEEKIEKAQDEININFKKLQELIAKFNEKVKEY